MRAITALRRCSWRVALPAAVSVATTVFGCRGAEDLEVPERVPPADAAPQQDDEQAPPPHRLSRASMQSERAIERGLLWLAKHQDEDGKWDSDAFFKHDPEADRCNGTGGAAYDVGVTALALLAFLEAGYTQRGSERENEYADNVRGAIRYLRGQQDHKGRFGEHSTRWAYNHGLATLAMATAYRMTRNPRYRKPAQSGLDFIAKVRNPGLAWRYEPRGGENDTSVTGLMITALQADPGGPLDIDAEAIDGARAWIDKMTEPASGRVGYDKRGGGPTRPEGMRDRFPPQKSHSMTAVGILTRMLLGEDPRRSEVIRKGIDLCFERLPNWNADDGSIDMYYWYYGSLAMYQVGGEQFRKWNHAMQKAALKGQQGKGSGAGAGSWAPIGAWGSEGGRVYSTAMMLLCLDMRRRSQRMHDARRALPRSLSFR